MEQGEREVHRLVAAWIGEEFDGQIDYADEFGVTDVLMGLNELREARTILTSETAKREMEKKLTAKIFARSPVKLRQDIEKEIQDADPSAGGLVESFGTLPAGMGNPADQDEGLEPDIADDQV